MIGEDIHDTISFAEIDGISYEITSRSWRIRGGPSGIIGFLGAGCMIYSWEPRFVVRLKEGDRETVVWEDGLAYSISGGYEEVVRGRRENIDRFISENHNRLCESLRAALTGGKA